MTAPPVYDGFELGVAQAALTTLGTMLTIGIGFLVKPGRATLYWACAFMLAMAASFAIVGGAANDLEVLRRAALGALMGAPPLLWSGFRAYWGLRPHAWAGVVVAVVSASLLALAPDQVWFTAAYRCVFTVAGIFGLALFVDWIRSSERRSDRAVLPLAIISVGFFALATGSLAAGVILVPTGGDDLGLLRVFSSIGMLVYVCCALTAIIGVTTRDARIAGATTADPDWVSFQRTATDRLARARSTSADWALVYIQIDDVADIRETVGMGALMSYSRHFLDEVRVVFPADADIGSPAHGAAVVLLSRSDVGLREYLRTMLGRVPDIDEEGALPTRPTASVGWAPAAMFGYEFDVLLYTARVAAEMASAKGGDRWEKVDAAVVEAVIKGTTQP